eukprot:EG_transcript_29062
MANIRKKIPLQPKCTHSQSCNFCSFSAFFHNFRNFSEGPNINCPTSFSGAGPQHVGCALVTMTDCNTGGVCARVGDVPDPWGVPPWPMRRTALNVRFSRSAPNF